MTIFFDLDATLLDHEHSHKTGLQALGDFSTELRKLFTDDLPARWKSAEHVHFTRYERGEISYLEQRRERLRECFPSVCRKLSDAELDVISSKYIEGYQSGWRLYPEVVTVFSNLAGPFALITNGDSKIQRAKIEHLQIEKYFKKILVSGEEGFAKPDPRIFKKACDELGVDPLEVPYVGDNFRNDVEGSAAAGMQPIWVNREALPRPTTQIRFREVRTLTELLES